MITVILYLGTANFGVAYGITNQQRLPDEEIAQILNWSVNKFQALDLSTDYEGATKSVKNYANNFKVSTKVVMDSYQKDGDLLKTISSEIQELKINSLDTLWVRSPKNFSSDSKRFWHELLEIQKQGLISKIGFSIYETYEIEELDRKFPGIDCFQVPESIADRRFSRLIQNNPRLKDKFQFVIRSILLQGLLTMPTESIPTRLKSVISFRDELLHHPETQNQSLIQLACGYANQLDWISGIIVGSNSLGQLKETYSYLTQHKKMSFDWLQRVMELPREITDPRIWSQV